MYKLYYYYVFGLTVYARVLDSINTLWSLFYNFVSIIIYMYLF